MHRTQTHHEICVSVIEREREEIVYKYINLNTLNISHIELNTIWFCVCVCVCICIFCSLQYGCIDIGGRRRVRETIQIAHCCQ